MNDRQDWPLYEIFLRATGLDHKHVGSLHATDDEWRSSTRAISTRAAGRGQHLGGALESTSSPLTRRRGMLLEPARDKLYRHPTFYDIPDEVKTLDAAVPLRAAARRHQPGAGASTRRVGRATRPRSRRTSASERRARPAGPGAAPARARRAAGGQRPRRGRTRVPARGIRVPEPDAGRAAERRLRRHHRRGNSCSTPRNPG